MAKGRLPTPDAAERGRRTRKLKTVENVRRFVADVLRRLESGEEEDVNRARTMLYGAQILAGLITGSAVEERLAALESRAPQQDASVQ